jgi:hypothetical protein
MEDRKNEDDPLDSPHGATSGQTVDLGLNTAIGKKLKAYYDDFASEPVPDRFLSLLDALDAAESAAKRTERS